MIEGSPGHSRFQPEERKEVLPMKLFQRLIEFILIKWVSHLDIEIAPNRRVFYALVASDVDGFNC